MKSVKAARRHRNLHRFKMQWELQVFALLGVAFLILFSYLPLAGIVIAFKDYSITSGFEGIVNSPWNDFRNFKEFFGYYRFWELFKNTMVLSVLKLVFSFPAPIILALLLSELRAQKFKRVVQTVSYLPNFISWVLVYTIANTFFNVDIGVVNQILLNIGIISEPFPAMTSPDAFYGMATFWAVWKNMGWWAIIFLAAITGLDPVLFEAADIDGAGRIKKIIHITLPGIKGAIITVLILSIGGLLGGSMGGSNFDQSYIFGNSINNSTSEIIQTYAFKMGLAQGRFSYATAVDLCQSMVSVTLILISNKVAKMTTGEGIF